MFSKVIHLCIIFQIIFHYRLLHDIEYSSLCYTVASYYLSILYNSRLYLLTLYSQIIPPLLSFPFGKHNLFFMFLSPFLFCIGESNGTPLQYSCLENPMDGGAWKAASPWGRWGMDMTERLHFTFHFHFSLSRSGEGNGNLLQCSCLENPRDRGAWWAAVYGVAQSRTWLKWLSSSSCFVYRFIYIIF